MRNLHAWAAFKALSKALLRLSKDLLGFLSHELPISSA